MLKSKETRMEAQKQGLEGKGPLPAANTVTGPISKDLKTQETTTATTSTEGTKAEKTQKKTKKMDQRQGINKAESAKNKEPQATMATEALTATDWWDSTGNDQVDESCRGADVGEAEGGEDNPQTTQTAAHEGALDNWDEDRTSQSSLPTSRGEKGSVLSKLSKTDRNTMRALIKISTLAGGDEAVAQQIETIISEQAKLKNLLMEQAQQIAFHKGRIEELEKRRQDTSNEQSKEATQSNSPANESRPTYALVDIFGYPGKERSGIAPKTKSRSA
ncbi:hypothetical protein MTO96_025855 [Rhipicephalus appendiculatus]